jgi:hypothetical protein
VFLHSFAERGSRQRRDRKCKRAGRGDREQRGIVGAGHQRAPKRYTLALLFPWHTDPLRFWLFGVAKNYPFAMTALSMIDRTFIKGEINSWNRWSECGSYRTHWFSSKPYPRPYDGSGHLCTRAATARGAFSRTTSLALTQADGKVPLICIPATTSWRA